MLQFAAPFAVHLPVPDGTVAQGDRQHFLAFYAGLLAGEASGGGGAVAFVLGGLALWLGLGL